MKRRMRSGACLRVVKQALRLAIGPAWAAGAISIGSLWAQTRPGLPNPKLLNSELLARGKVVYQNQCAGCHGEKGDGKGPAAYGLFPKPRDFTSATFKFRSTPQSALPTDEDLVRIVRQGVLGTSMPAFDLMAERDVLAVVQYLKVFSEAWKDAQNYAAPIHVPPPPAWFTDLKEREQRAGKGRELFVGACAPCHGEQGDGKGPSAAVLVDSWQQPLSPADLRKPFIRSGRNLSDLYKVLSTGVNGTPMPSFVEVAGEEQRWELVAFIDELRRAKGGGKPEVVREPPATIAAASTNSPKPSPKDAPSPYE